jgi:hypothetical protein
MSPNVPRGRVKPKLDCPEVQGNAPAAAEKGFGEALNILTILLVPVVGMAEPSAAVKYLMDDSVSAFDFGLYQVASRLQNPARDYGVPAGYGDVSANVDYDWGRNRIVARLYVYMKAKVLPPSVAKEVCRETIATARSVGGISRQTGARETDYPSYAALFQHNSFARNSSPKELEDELLSIIEFSVKVVVGSINSTGPLKITACQAPLLGKEVLFAE